MRSSATTCDNGEAERAGAARAVRRDPVVRVPRVCVGVARGVVQNHYYVMHEKIGFRSTYSLRILQIALSHMSAAPHRLPERASQPNASGMNECLACCRDRYRAAWR